MLLLPRITSYYESVSSVLQLSVKYVHLVLKKRMKDVFEASNVIKIATLILHRWNVPGVIPHVKPVRGVDLKVVHPVKLLGRTVPISMHVCHAVHPRMISQAHAVTVIVEENDVCKDGKKMNSMII